MTNSRVQRAADRPPLPKPDRDGNYPAVEYARAGLARNVMTGRVNAGLTQRALAKLAGIRFETVCRIEKGRHTPSVPTIDRIERALQRSAESKAPVMVRNSRRFGTEKKLSGRHLGTTRRTRESKGG